MQFSYTCFILSTTFLFVSVSAGKADKAPMPATPTPFAPPRNITIRNVTASGSGCPRDSFSAALSKDGLSFTLIFDKFVAFSGAGSTPQDVRKQCQVILDLDYPASNSFSVVGVSYRGFLQLNEGVEGKIMSKLEMNDGLKVDKGRGRNLQSNTVTSGANFKGPLVQDFLQTDTSPSNNLVWTDCRRRVPAYGYYAANMASEEILPRKPVVVNAEIQLVGNATQLDLGNQITIDSLDGKLNHTFTLQWRDC